MAMTTGRLNRMSMRHRIRTPMGIPTREATTVPFRVRGVDTEAGIGAVGLGVATDTFPLTDLAIHACRRGLFPVRPDQFRRSFKKVGNVWGHQSRLCHGTVP